MSKHYCQADLPRAGQIYWGRPSEGPPPVEPCPDIVFEMHPDVITDWDNCDDCGSPMCGKPAPFGIRDEDGEGVTWLCAEHYDECVDWKCANWHQCRG